MSEIQQWQNLPRSLLDNTKIDEAIAEAIDAHNDDTDAHLLTDQALEVHRQNDVIDHPAESVVNDKMYPVARAYVAIVDPTSDTDFDTIQGAIAYAITKGGGTVLITAGTHYLSGDIDLPLNINLYGVDQESVIVIGDFDSGDYLKLQDDTVTSQNNIQISNITFQTSGSYVVSGATTDLDTNSVITFNNCIFTGGGGVVYIETANIFYNICKFYCDNDYCIANSGNIVVRESQVLRYGTASNARFMDCVTGGTTNNYFNFHECLLDTSGATNSYYFNYAGEPQISMFNTDVRNWFTNGNSFYFIKVINCIITLKNNHDLQISTDSGESLVANCLISPSGSGVIICSSPDIGFIGCNIRGGYDSFNSDVAVNGDMAILPFYVLLNSATAVGLDMFNTAVLTPNSTRTLTSLVPRAGERRTLIILTSGITSYTLTFGTGFKTTGTLATGATSARRFVIEFISDGSYLIESSRTTAIA